MVQEIDNVLDILEQAKKAIKADDALAIKELSNRTIHTSTIQQDPDNINIAVVLYALSKIMERTRYRELPGWKIFQSTYEDSIDKAFMALKRKDIEVYREQINRIKDSIKKLSGHLKTYVEEIFRKASITKGSRIYEHGISLEATAKILGVTQWELNQYVGQTGIADVNLAYTKDIKERIKDVEEIFK